jgi:hypothetical protein
MGSRVSIIDIPRRMFALLTHSIRKITTWLKHEHCDPVIN